MIKCVQYIWRVYITVAGKLQLPVIQIQGPSGVVLHKSVTMLCNASAELSNSSTTQLVYVWRWNGAALNDSHINTKFSLSPSGDTLTLLEFTLGDSGASCSCQIVTTDGDLWSDWSVPVTLAGKLSDVILRHLIAFYTCLLHAVTVSVFQQPVS